MRHHELDILVNTLKNKELDIGIRDDAAMELGQYTCEKSIQALIEVAQNPREDEMVSESCGESLADIWIKKDHFEENIYLLLNKSAKEGVYITLLSRQSSWIEKFNI